MNTHPRNYEEAMVVLREANRIAKRACEEAYKQGYKDGTDDAIARISDITGLK